jgi:hypothetical protein
MGGSGSDLVSGEYNGFEATTILGGQLPTLSSAKFAGNFIIEVRPIGVNSDFITPRQELGGILGVGCDDGNSQHAGAGVTGYGSPSQGVGVVGKGGQDFTYNNNQIEKGAGGIGVNGIGGNGFKTGNEDVSPGTGVLGQGGAPAVPLNPGGAGVLGVAGGATVPPFQNSAGVGVFGTGQRAALSNLGNSPAGPGVVGQGGYPLGGPGGGGVVGVAGGAGIPSFQESLDIGVFGTGPKAGVYGVSSGSGTGVFGTSNSGTGVNGTSNSGVGVSGSSPTGIGVEGLSNIGPGVAGGSTNGPGVFGNSGNGPGVSGLSSNNRGGIFASSHFAQVKMEPSKTPMAVSGNPPKLRPAITGEPGDLLAVTVPPAAGGPPISSLWFYTGDPASPWKEVSLT